MVAQFLGPFNGQLPTHEASGKLVVDFSRNPKKFKLAQYCQYVPTGGNANDRPVQGMYYVMSTNEAVRATDDEGIDAVWADGADRPKGTVDEQFEAVTFRTVRRERGFRIGFDTAKAPTWNEIARRGSLASSRLMTIRTLNAVKKLTTSGNYPAAHTAVVSAISGNSGTWAQSTTARMDIKRSLLYAANVIRLATNGVVSPSDLKLVISPTDAIAMAQTQEIVDMIKQSPDARAFIDGEWKGKNLNATWGLPPTLHGFELIVEDGVKNTAKRGGTQTKADIWPTGKAALVSRIGGLMSEDAEIGPSFSTLTCFLRSELAIETDSDAWNKVHKGSVVDDYVMALTATPAAFLFTTTV